MPDGVLDVLDVLDGVVDAVGSRGTRTDVGAGANGSVGAVTLVPVEAGWPAVGSVDGVSSGVDGLASVWTGAGACPVDADADVAAEANTDGLGGVTATAGGGAGLAGGNEGSGPTGSIRTTGGTVPA